MPQTHPYASVIVVVPTYNEVANMAGLLAELAACPLPNLHVLVVDDNSPDGTAEEVDRVSARLEREGFTSVLRRPVKQGLGRAYVAGMKEALRRGAELVVQMDADLSHQPRYIAAMVERQIATNADVVIGSRYVVGGSLADEWRLHRRLLSSWANLYVNAILGLRIRDATAGFKVWRASMLDKIGLDDLRSNGYSFQVEMNYRCLRLGGQLVEFPIHFRERDSGVSKMTLGVKLESAVMPIKLRLSVRDTPTRRR